MPRADAGIEFLFFVEDTALFERYGNFLENYFSDDTLAQSHAPITEFREALVLLYEKRNDRTVRRLRVRVGLPDGTYGPGIEIGIYNGGYCKDELAKTFVFPITTQLLKELLAANILSGTQYRGRIDNSELHLDARSTARIIEEVTKYSEELEAAKQTGEF